MAEQKVELRKVRDFSENLNDTFLFIRQNFKPLLTCFIGIAGIFMLAVAILSGIYQRQFSGMFSDILSRRASGYGSVLTIFNANYFLLLLLAWLNFIAMEVVVISYLKVYDSKNGEQPAFDEVWSNFKRYFFKVFFYTIPVFLLIVIGCVFCLAPGIYLAVVFTPFSSILIIEDESFSGAFNRCFRLIKDNFWISFGIYALTYTIASFGSGVISLAVQGISAVLSSFTANNLDESVDTIVSVLDIFGFIFLIVYYLSVTLHYFNLAERHDGTGLMKKLDSIGGNDQDFKNIQEQY